MSTASLADAGNMMMEGETLWCPCPAPWEPVNDFTSNRELQEEPDSTMWQMVYVGVTLVVMFAVLLTDKVGADLVMTAALTACMAANIITIGEGVAGFANEGVLTVVVLFVVASGLQLTGGLDWHMTKILGQPSSIAAAQFRLMVPVSIISAFLNNTPLVIIMIPICLKWGKNNGISPAQLLVPLSFCTILGGTCTLIGTSTNLVVAGLYVEYYPDKPPIGLFDLGVYGVPVLFIGLAYIIVASQYLLPGGKTRRDTADPIDDDGTILLAARLTKWSPAAGTTVKRSGLRDTGGVYLVSVYRARSGNMHRAVGQDFVLNADDVLYFTGLVVQEFTKFANNHGLEIVTNEVDIITAHSGEEQTNGDAVSSDRNNDPQDVRQTSVKCATTEVKDIETPFTRVERRRSTLLLSEKELKFQAINKLTETMRGYKPSQELDSAPRDPIFAGPAKVIVVVDSQDLEHVIIIGINSHDRPGLLRDISRGIGNLGLQVHHTEASVIQSRSISVWRCELIDGGGNLDAAEMQAVLSSLLEHEYGTEASKLRGISVIRAVVTHQSRLCGKTLEDANFREMYDAAVIAVQKKDSSNVDELKKVCFAPGDLLVLQAKDDSLLLVRPPSDFYKSETKGQKNSGHKDSVDYSLEQSQVWGDLRVLFNENEGQDEGGNLSREFLAAVKVSAKSLHIDKTVAEAGLDRQAGLFLVSVERPVICDMLRTSFTILSLAPGSSPTNLPDSMSMLPVPPEGHLKENDILWFAGDAAAIADLRKIPGLSLLEDDQIQNLEGKRHDRTLVHAVIAKKGPLVGKTAVEVGFRTIYGAAVIAISRSGKRVQDHPGNIKLQAGDVLLLEAGPTFISSNTNNQHSFALISPVKDTKPPRLDKLIPAIVLIVAMLAVVTFAPLYADQNMGSLLVCGLVTAFLMVCMGILSQQECRDAIYWDVYITIACAFGLGTAMTNSGLANLIADGLVYVGVGLGIGDAGVYGSIYLATFLISNIVTNNAAAALMFPIGANAAVKSGADELLMSYNIMLAASASFMSPFGYTTNLLVYGPGGYKVKDFVYIGTPMQVILWIVTVSILSNTTTPWWVSWIWSFGVFALVSLVFVFPSLVKSHWKKAKDVARDKRGV